MFPGLDPSRIALFVPALGALGLLMLDLFARPRVSGQAPRRATALSGIRTASMAIVVLGLVPLLLRPDAAAEAARPGLFRLDAFAVFGISSVLLFSLLVLSLSLTHFGMARSRPAEPLALLLFSLSGLAMAMASDHLLVWLLALDLAWLPLIGLVAIDSRRLSSSESSLKTFFAHGLASIVFAVGAVMVFGATGSLGLGSLGSVPLQQPMLWKAGATLLLVGLLIRGGSAPFHPWAPDVFDGAPSFVTAHIATAAQTTTFVVLLRLLNTLLPGAETELEGDFAERIPALLSVLGCLGLVWGHAMALVQLGLRRLLGWIGVGQVGFFVLALVDARGQGGEALLFGLIATGIATTGVLAILSSLSHHERACESIGDLSGMMQTSPIRAGLLALFLLSLAGFPGTMGFVARLRILSAVDEGTHRGLVVFGLAATVLALASVGRPLLAMLRPETSTRAPSRALTHEQFVLTICGGLLLYFGFVPAIEDRNLASGLTRWIAEAVLSLHR